jgi:hypothetical protein
LYDDILICPLCPRDMSNKTLFIRIPLYGSLIAGLLVILLAIMQKYYNIFPGEAGIALTPVFFPGALAADKVEKLFPIIGTSLAYRELTLWSCIVFINTGIAWFFLLVVCAVIKFLNVLYKTI